MFSKSLSGLLFAALPPAILSSPIESRAPIAVASSSNLYLVTCTQYGGNGRWGNSDSSAAGVAFFKTPISTTPSPGGGRWNWNWDTSPQPDEVAILSSPATAWEGTKRQITVWDNKPFSLQITAEAGTLSKGQIAGDASLGSESFVCFKDGETEIGLVGSDDGGEGWGQWRGPGGGRWGGGRWGGGRRPPGWNGRNNRAQCKADYWCASLG